MGKIITWHNADGDTITLEQGNYIAGLEALTACMMILSLVAVALRLYARRLRKAYIGWDDYFSIGSVITILAYGAMVFYGCVHGGLAQHEAINQTIDYPILTRRLKITMEIAFASNVVSQLMIGFGKLSVLFLYRRIFRSSNQTWFPIAIWTMVAIVIVWIVSFFFSNLLECHPMHANWDSTGGTADQCINELPMLYGQMYSDTLTDLMILIIPIPCVWALHMPRKQKIAVMGMFLLGTVTVLMSALKLYYWWVAFELLGGPPTWNDLTYIETPTVSWPLIEAAVAVVGGCLPLYKPLFDDCLPIVRLTSYLRELTSPSKSGGSQYGLFTDREKWTNGTSDTKPSASSNFAHDTVSVSDEKADLS